MTNADHSELHQWLTCRLPTLSRCADHSQLSVTMWDWMRLFFNHLMYFVFCKNDCIVLKINVPAFYAFWDYFCVLLYKILEKNRRFILEMDFYVRDNLSVPFNHEHRECVCVCVCSTYLSSYVMFSPVACSKVTLFRPNTLQYKVQSSNVHILVLLAVSVHSAADGCLLIPLPQPVFSYSMTLSHGLVENWSKHHWFSVPNESRSSLEVTNDLSSPSRPTNYVEYTSSWGLSSKFPARCRI